MAILENITQAVEWFQNNSADPIFMDIHLGDGNSFGINRQPPKDLIYLDLLGAAYLFMLIIEVYLRLTFPNLEKILTFDCGASFCPIIASMVVLELSTILVMVFESSG